MEKNNQKQTAGDNSQLLQIQELTVNTGIDEKRAREICTEVFSQRAKEITKEAEEKAFQRTEKFANVLIPRIQKVENALDAFSEPDFQYDLCLAQKSATCTENISDYELLSELLTERVKAKKDRKKAVSIRKAIGVVNEIDDEALCALSLYYVVTKFECNALNMYQHLDSMDRLYGSLRYKELSNNNEWIEHLELLNTIVADMNSKFKSFEDYFCEKYNGFWALGIEVDSENYNKAIDLLKENNIPNTILIKQDNYITVNVRNRKAINNLVVPVINDTGLSFYKPRNDKEIKIIDSIFDMYESNSVKEDELKKKFIQEIKKFQNINFVCDWWNSFPYFFRLTSVGEVLAHSNAEKYNKNIPKWNN